MQITPLYLKFKEGKLTLTRFAEKLGISEIQLKIRLAKHGENAGKRFLILDKIAMNLITRDQAAIEWGGVNVRTINAAMKAWGVEREMTEDMVSRVAPKVKWEVIKKYAVDFIQGSLDLSKSAKAAGVSERQLRRWVSDLLEKHYDMPWKDLKEVSLRRRQELAKDILKSEDLESDKQKAILPVLTGEKSRFEEAEARITVRRAASAEVRARKAGKLALADERAARRLITEFLKPQGISYLQFKSLPKNKREALLAALTTPKSTETARILNAHLESLPDV